MEIIIIMVLILTCCNLALMGATVYFIYKLVDVIGKLPCIEEEEDE